MMFRNAGRNVPFTPVRRISGSPKATATTTLVRSPSDDAVPPGASDCSRLLLGEDRTVLRDPGGGPPRRTGHGPGLPPRSRGRSRGVPAPCARPRTDSLRRCCRCRPGTVHRAHHEQEEGIAAGLRDRFVEREVGFEELLVGRIGGLQAFVESVELGELSRGPPGLANAAISTSRTRREFHELLEGAPAEAEEEPVLLGDDAAVDGGHGHSAAWTDGRQATLDEEPRRLPDDGTAHAEPLDQLGFGGEAVAGRQAEDVFLKGLRDGVREALLGADAPCAMDANVRNRDPDVKGFGAIDVGGATRLFPRRHGNMQVEGLGGRTMHGNFVSPTASQSACARGCAPHLCRVSTDPVDTHDSEVHMFLHVQRLINEIAARRAGSGCSQRAAGGSGRSVRRDADDDAVPVPGINFRGDAPQAVQGPAPGCRHRGDQPRRADRHHDLPAAGRLPAVSGQEVRPDRQARSQRRDPAVDRAGHRNIHHYLVGAQGALPVDAVGNPWSGPTCTTAATWCWICCTT